MLSFLNMYVMKTIQMSKLLFLTTITFLLFTIGCSKSKVNNPELHVASEAIEVWLQKIQYNPTPKNVEVNTSVIWTNQGC